MTVTGNSFVCDGAICCAEDRAEGDVRSGGMGWFWMKLESSGMESIGFKPRMTGAACCLLLGALAGDARLSMWGFITRPDWTRH